MFVALLTQPYATATLGIPVYLDGLAFAGLISLQIIDKDWPATANLVDDTVSIQMAFDRSTHITKIQDDTTNDNIIQI